MSASFWHLHKFSPKEHLLGLIVNTTLTPLSTAIAEPSNSEVDVQIAYINQQHLNAADHMALHATKCKAAFDCIVKQSKAGEVVFKKDQLVQVYNSFQDNTMSTSRKLLPQWSTPCHVVECTRNSYHLATLEGFPMGGLVHTWRLHRFIPRMGTALAELEELKMGEQEGVEEEWGEEDMEEENEGEGEDECEGVEEREGGETMEEEDSADKGDIGGRQD